MIKNLNLKKEITIFCSLNRTFKKFDVDKDSKDK